MWDPAAYLRFGSERARPFFDLLTRVQAADPGYVVDLGCGPGNLTALLAARWPEAHVLGVDSSAEMIEAARAERSGAAPAGVGRATADGSRLAFALADIRSWQPGRPVDVITCNAVLQWVPGHLNLLTTWAGWLAPGGWLAFQVPGNFDQPSHTILRDLAASAQWRDLLAGVQLNRQAMDPADYLDVLAAAELRGGRVGNHLPARAARGERGARLVPGQWAAPGAGRADPGRRGRVRRRVRAQLRAAYPPAPYGTVLPFRRVFVVAHR